LNIKYFFTHSIHPKKQSWKARSVLFVCFLLMSVGGGVGFEILACIVS
jgi:hypothetical protein